MGPLESVFRENGEEVPPEIRAAGGKGYPQSLPMGWNWAVCISQNIHTTSLDRLRGKEVEDGHVFHLVREKVPNPALSTKVSLGFRYIDDNGVFSVTERGANLHHERTRAEFAREGLPLHPEKTPRAALGSIRLGVDVGGEEPRLRVQRQKRWNLEGAVRCLGMEGRASPDTIACVVGHFTHAQLLHRLLLSIWDQSYPFSHSSNRRCQRLPQLVFQELLLAADLPPLTLCDRGPSFDSRVYLGDPSEEHLSVMRGEVPPEVVKEV